MSLPRPYPCLLPYLPVSLPPGVCVPGTGLSPHAVSLDVCVETRTRGRPRAAPRGTNGVRKKLRKASASTPLPRCPPPFRRGEEHRDVCRRAHPRGSLMPEAGTAGTPGPPRPHPAGRSRTGALAPAWRCAAGRVPPRRPAARGSDRRRPCARVSGQRGRARHDQARAVVEDSNQCDAADTYSRSEQTGRVAYSREAYSAKQEDPA